MPLKNTTKKTTKAVSMWVMETPFIKEPWSCCSDKSSGWNSCCSNDEWWCNGKFMVLWVIIVCSALIMASNYYFIKNMVSFWWAQGGLTETQIGNIVEKQLEESEILKAGWKENYDMMKKLFTSEVYKSQQRQSLEWALQQFWLAWSENSDKWDNTIWVDAWSVGTWEKQDSNWLDPNFKTWQITAGEIASLKEWSFIKWNEWAKISWLEYSDVECPYCKRLHTQWTVKAVTEKFKDDLNYMFKHFPLEELHANAKTWSLLLECVWELWGKDKFFEFEEAIFALWFNSTSWEPLPPSFENVKTIIDNMWIDSAKVEKCVNSWEYLEKINSIMSQWTKMFGVTWTPGNVLINNETGKWVMIPWAYPENEFSKVINYLME